MVLEAHEAETPVGRPVEIPIPVASVVLCVILVNGVLIQRVGVLDATLEVILLAFTVTILLDVVVPHELVVVTE